ncbi:phospholipase D-like domain-containing protein [Rhizobium sp. LEGMi12c]
MDYKLTITHSKIIVIDDRLTSGGSYNYTAAAQKRNTENVTFTESADIARQFLTNWDARLRESRAFDVPAG